MKIEIVFEVPDMLLHSIFKTGFDPLQDIVIRADTDEKSDLLFNCLKVAEEQRVRDNEYFQDL